MKKQIFRGIVVLLSLAFMALPALSAVSIAPNDKGDLLIYPMYYAMEGIQTNIEVINTSPTKCAVAKVIVRSHKYSLEVLDFLIYLTPNDVFKGTLKYEGGKYVLVSTDDSLCLGDSAANRVCASVDAPIALELYAPTYACACATDDSQDYGYIEIIEATSYSVPATCGDDTLCCKQADGTILKADLFAKYWADGGTMDPDNILTGHAEMVFPGAEYALYKPTVLKDYNNSVKLNIGVLTTWGLRTNEIEAALSKNRLVIPYFNQSDAFTVAWVNFPTKQMLCDLNDENCDAWYTESCYFNHVAKFSPSYNVDMYDLEEHVKTSEGCLRSPCAPTETNRLPEEVNLVYTWLGSGNPFSEGWARLSLEVTPPTEGFVGCETDCVRYEGSPVIGLIGEITPEGLSLMAPAYDFGTIVKDGTNVDGGCYQLGCDPCLDD